MTETARPESERDVVLSFDVEVCMAGSVVWGPHDLGESFRCHVAAVLKFEKRGDMAVVSPLVDLVDVWLWKGGRVGLGCGCH